MAWVTEYDMGFTGFRNDTAGTIELQRDGGSYQESLPFVKESLEIRKVLPDYDHGIVRMNASFAIQNNKSDFYELLPLMTISAGKIRVVITQTDPATEILFVGFLNCEAVSQGMLWNQPIHFTASGLFNKLDRLYPLTIDIRQNLSLIDIIDDCLVMTGHSYPIRVRCRLEEVNSPLGAAQTLFNRSGIFTELFWDNNVDRMSALKILEKILQTFNCYLYWYDEYWYIVHYTELASSSGYVEYDSGTSAGYQYDDSGSWSNAAYSTLAIHAPTTRPQANRSQRMTIQPGLAQLDVRKSEKQYWNLLNGDLSDPVVNGVETDRWFPPLRTWHAYDDSIVYNWVNRGEPFQDIANSIMRLGGYDTSSGDGVLNGLTTSFKISVQEDTEITIKFKFGLPHAYGPPDPAFFDNPGDTEITFPWFLRFGPIGYCVYGESSGEWSSSAFMTANTLVITGDDLDQNRWTYEGELVVPIGQIMFDLLGSSSALEQELTMYFRMGTENFEDTVGAAWDEPCDAAVYGDFNAIITETLPDNLLRGTHNSDFLDKKEIELIMFDTTWTYRNALLRGTDFVALTQEWGFGSEFESLARHILKEKFQLYNVARQKMRVEYISDTPLRPLQGFHDGKQSNKEFVALSYIYYPEKNTHDVELWEYDDSTVINLV